MPDAWDTQESAKSGTGDVQALALEVLGNLAFCSAHTSALQTAEPLRPLLVRLASSDGGGSAITARARMAAIRALAILGKLLRWCCQLALCHHIAVSCPLKMSKGTILAGCNVEPGLLRNVQTVDSC